MARKPLIRSSTHPYHVFNRSNNKDSFYLPPEKIWPIFSHYLVEASTRYRSIIWAFVQMSNHFHLLVSTPRENLDAMMRYFQTEVCREIQRQSGRINHIFGTRYKWSLLADPSAVGYVYKYICRNPVRAGMCESVQDYEYSSLNQPFPTADGIGPLWTYVPKSFPKRLEWLNQPTPKEQEQLIRKALRRSRYKFTTNNTHQKLLRQLQHSYGVGTPGTL